MLIVYAWYCSAYSYQEKKNSEFVWRQGTVFSRIVLNSSVTASRLLLCRRFLGVTQSSLKDWVKSLRANFSWWRDQVFIFCFPSLTFSGFRFKEPPLSGTLSAIFAPSVVYVKRPECMILSYNKRYGNHWGDK